MNAIRKSSNTLGKFVCLFLGYLLLIPSLFLWAFVVISGQDGNWEMSGAVSVFATLLSAVGCALVLAGRGNGAYWLCPSCQNKLPNPEARVCPVCRADIR